MTIPAKYTLTEAHFIIAELEKERSEMLRNLGTERKALVAERDAAILDRDHWYNDPESRDAVARAEAHAEAAEARVTELEEVVACRNGDVETWMNQWREQADRVTELEAEIASYRDPHNELVDRQGYKDTIAAVAAAEAELAEMRHQGVIAWREIVEDELKDAVAGRDEANVQWHKIRDLHADAVSEVARLREALQAPDGFYTAAKDDA